MANIVSEVAGGLESVLAKVNVPALITAANSLVAAWPSLSADAVQMATTIPAYVADIEKALSGQTPTDTDWTALDATLDAGDADIAAAGAAAQAQIDSGSTGT